jgi:hypothetical protein
MRVNTNHPSFISFLETVTSNILTNVSVDSYFSLNQEKKLGVQYMVLKLIKSSVKVRAKLTDTELIFYGRKTKSLKIMNSQQY